MNPELPRLVAIIGATVTGSTWLLCFAKALLFICSGEHKMARTGYLICTLGSALFGVCLAIAVTL